MDLQRSYKTAIISFTKGEGNKQHIVQGHLNGILFWHSFFYLYIGRAFNVKGCRFKKETYFKEYLFSDLNVVSLVMKRTGYFH